MRCLKLYAELVDSNTYVKVKVMEQSHFDKYFSVPEKGTPYGAQFVHDGYSLASVAGLSFAEITYVTGLPTLYLPSSPAPAKDCLVPIEHWKGVRKAVEAYNEYFKK